MTATTTTWIGKLHQRFLKGDSLRAQLVRGGLGSITLKAANVGLSFAVAVFLARLLGPDGYGLYAYVLALITIMTVPAQFGLQNLIVREVAANRAHGEWGLLWWSVRTRIGLRLQVGAISIAGSALGQCDSRKKTGAS